jgi:hypothetical protein
MTWIRRPNLASRPAPPRWVQSITLGLALLSGAALCACGSYSVMVTPQGQRRAPLPYGTPFRIDRGNPPRGATLVGKIGFETSANRVEEALNEVRDRVRLVGGNLVTNLRCNSVGTFVVHTRGNAVVGNPRLTGAKMHCQGRVYRVR